MSQKTQMIFLSVLGIALVVVLVRALSSGPAAPATAKPKAGDNVTAAASIVPAGTATFRDADIDVDALLKEIEVVTFDYGSAHGDRDPMRSLIHRIPTGGGGQTTEIQRVEVVNFRITGIVWDERDPIAIVRDEMSAEGGDQVINVGYTYPSGVQVHSIEPNRVVFKVDDQLMPVEMREKEF